MRRAAYRALLALHPPAFRRQFAGEMLWVFDQADGDREASGFCGDVAGSLLRQWLRQPALWVTAGSLAGSILTMMWMFAIVPNLPLKRSLLEMDDVIVLALGSLVAISFTLITIVALCHSLRRQKL